jgi:uncharacterized protein (UPF0210 family)
MSVSVRKGDVPAGDVEMQERRTGKVMVPAGGGARGDMIDSHSLFGKGNEIAIRHGDHVYRLRITRNGRLILNK